jgi:hypothetical protein
VSRPVQTHAIVLAPDVQHGSASWSPRSPVVLQSFSKSDRTLSPRFQIGAESMSFCCFQACGSCPLSSGSVSHPLRFIFQSLCFYICASVDSGLHHNSTCMNISPAHGQNSMEPLPPPIPGRLGATCLPQMPGDYLLCRNPLPPGRPGATCALRMSGGPGVTRGIDLGNGPLAPRAAGGRMPGGALGYTWIFNTCFSLTKLCLKGSYLVT